MNKDIFKYVSLNEWLKLPRSERAPLKWYWPTGWYQAPFPMTLNGWSTWEEYVKVKYPIQYWFREYFYHKLRHKYHFIKELKYRIINPRREMRNAVFPSRWVDLVEIVPEFHFQVIVEYVEREKALENVDWNTNETNPKVLEVGKKLKEYYNYIKIERPFLLEKLDMAFFKLDFTDPSFNTRYDRVDEIEKSIKDKDTELCIWVVQNRSYLWT